MLFTQNNSCTDPGSLLARQHKLLWTYFMRWTNSHIEDGKFPDFQPRGTTHRYCLGVAGRWHLPNFCPPPLLAFSLSNSDWYCDWAGFKQRQSGMGRATQLGIEIPRNEVWDDWCLHMSKKSCASHTLGAALRSPELPVPACSCFGTGVSWHWQDVSQHEKNDSVFNDYLSNLFFRPSGLQIAACRWIEMCWLKMQNYKSLVCHSEPQGK